MSHWTGDCESPLYREILRRSAQRNDGEYKDVITTTIAPEKLKTLYLEMLDEVGVGIMLYTFACGVITDSNKLCGVKVVNKSGFSDIYADVVIDASGDGDIAFKCGARTARDVKATAKCSRRQ